MNAELELGPIDVVVIGYPADAARTGEAIPIFVDLVERGVVRVLDVLMVEKTADGEVAGIEINELGENGGELTVFQGARTGMLDDDDASTAGELLERGEMAVLICYENAWAAPFATAVRRNGGRVIAFERVGAQDVMDALDAVEAAEASA